MRGLSATATDPVRKRPSASPTAGGVRLQLVPNSPRHYSAFAHSTLAANHEPSAPDFSEIIHENLLSLCRTFDTISVSSSIIVEVRKQVLP
jgi:hypothetical protein